MEPRLLLSTGPLISEFMAVNDTTLADEDGDYSDWIEIHNPTDAAVDLTGWHLTDDALDLTEWTFPAMTIGGGEYLVVFASDKDRRDPAGELHTDFKLDGSGEYLALVEPDGTTLADEYAPTFPRQLADVSYGAGSRELIGDTLVGEGDGVRVLVPANGSLGATWTQGSFDDSAWIGGDSGVGYETEDAPAAFEAKINFQPGGAPVPSGYAADSGLPFGDRGGGLSYGWDQDISADARDRDTHADPRYDTLNHMQRSAARTWEIAVPNGRYRVYAVFGDPSYTDHVNTIDIEGAVQTDPDGGDSFDEYSLSVTVADGRLTLQPAAGAGNAKVAFVEIASAAPPTYEGLIETDLEAEMFGQGASAYIRSTFEVAEPADYVSMTLRMSYDDGYVAYLNGVEIARRNAPASPAFDSAATGEHPDEQAIAFEDVDVSAFLGELNAGSNVLAVHGLNAAADDVDFLIAGELHAAVTWVNPPQYFATPTPGAENVPGALDVVADIQFSTPRGFYDQPFSVVIACETDGAEIRYTTDGTVPTATTGSAHGDPIPVDTTTTLRAAAFKPGWVSSQVETHTYVFLADVIEQDGAGFPNNWGHAGADYRMDPDVVDSPAYRDTIQDDLKSIPTVSLVMDPDDWFAGGGQGIYIQGKGSERAVSAELIHADGTEGFQIDSAVQIQGGSSTSRWKVDKLSMRLKFKEPYGPTKLDFPLFEDSPVDRFDTLILDAMMNLSWLHPDAGQRRKAQYVRDQYVADIQNGLGSYGPHGFYVHLYLNGLYWGLYWLHERPDESFAASYLGGEKEDYYVLKHNSGRVVNGGSAASADYKEMLDIAAAGLSTDAQYQLIQQHLDIPDFIDYMIANFYTGNTDWAHHNWYASRNSADPDGRWRFHSWDAEHVLKGADDNVTGRNNSGAPTFLHQKLRANAEYRLLFADRVQEYFLNGGPLTADNARALYEARLNQVDRAVVGESARWGDNRRATPYTRDNEWAAERDWLLDTYFPGRTSEVLDQLRSRNLFPDVSAPSFNQHGGQADPPFELTMGAPAGIVYYTLDGSDPRLPGGDVSPGAERYTPATIEQTPVAKKSTWRYLDDGSDRGTAWREPAFDDTAWVAGPAELGYGDGGEATEVSFGPDGGHKYTTTYFRHAFDVTGAAQITDLTLQLLRDDGAVVYLNGRQLPPSNMPGGTILYDTFAKDTVGGADESTFFDIPVDAGLLVDGENVLAVEIHQGNLTSSDISFDLELKATRTGVETPITLNRSTRVKARALDGGDWSALSEGVFVIGTPPVRITEVMYHPADPPDGSSFVDEDFEFLEVRNISAEPFNLQGMTLADGVEFTFGDLELAPGEFAVVLSNQAAFEWRYGATDIAVAGVYTGLLENTGETIQLVGAFGEPIHTFAYDPAWYPLTDGDGHSLVIVDSQADPSTWGLKDSWLPSAFASGSPGLDDAGLSGGLIAINEIHYHPDVKTELVEFVEVHNASQADVQIGGWHFSDGVDYTFPLGTVVPAGGYVVVAQDPAQFEAKFGFAPLGPYTGRLANEGDQIMLRDAFGGRIDRVDYGGAFPWPIVGDPPGPSIELVHPLLDNDLGGSWRPGGPTPGAGNSVFATTLPPHMRQVSHSPRQPASGEPVAITVKVTDGDGVAAVTLDYQLVDPGSYITLDDPEYATSWTSLAMHDDGLGGDEAAGDSIYTVLLPGDLQTHRRLVRYRITAEDALGASVTGPYSEDPQPNYAYFVYDRLPSWSGAAQPGSADPDMAEVVTYDATHLGSVPVYHLISKKSDVENSQWIDRYSGSDYPWTGTLVYDGVVYDHITYRARGGVWRYAMGKNMWKFDFLDGHQFQAEDNYGTPYAAEWDKLNFSACIQQGNYLHRGEQGLFEAVGFDLFNLVGVEAPKTHYVHFRVIDEAEEAGPTQYDGDFWGLYLVTEQPDGRFLDEHDLPDGNLYKMEGGTGSLNNQGPIAATDKSDLNAFLDTYKNTTPTEQWWRENLDLESYYSYRAIVEGIHHYDIGYGKNYFYYLDPQTDTWSVLPWDVDLTWADNMYGNGSDPFKSRVANRDEFNREYQNRMREIRDLLYNTDQAYQLIDEWASIIHDPAGPSLVDADRALWDYNPVMASSYVNPSKAGQGRFYESSATGDFAGMVQLMKDYVVTRGAWIDSQILTDTDIPEKPTVTYEGPPGYPAHLLGFAGSAFSGTGSFAAMEWRIGEVTDPASPSYDPNAPWAYEIEAVWESGELATFDPLVTIPVEPIQAGHAYRVRVRMKDDGGRWSHWSDPVQFVAGDPIDAMADDLRITEIMYHPAAPPQGSGYTDEDFEFIELRNVGTDPLNLEGLRFTDGVDFTFGDIELAAGEYLVVVSNQLAFQSRYGTSGITIAGEYTLRLNNNGEKIRLETQAGGVIVSFEYDDAWQPITDGGTSSGVPHPVTGGEGFSLVVLDPEGDLDNWNHECGWRPSALTGGSPGADEAGVAPGSVLINEAMSHTDQSPGDWIELYNPTDADVDIGGWYLSDESGWDAQHEVFDPDLRTKYQIQPGTTVPAGGFAVFTYDDHFGNAAAPGCNEVFGLSELGEAVYLASPGAAGEWGGYRHVQDFGAADREVSFGRHVNSAGGEDFVAMSAATRGAENASPKVGPVVINEIMYHPPIGGYEFLELLNLTDADIPLYDAADPGNADKRWHLAGAGEYVFPSGPAAVLPAGGYLLVVGIEPGVFRAAYGIPQAVPIFGPYSGSLSNTGESIRLYKPGDPEPDGTVPQILVERVKYDDRAPWPVQADGNGAALARRVAADYGNDPAAWSDSTAGGTPGAANAFTDTTPPSVPADLDAAAVSSSEITLAWSAAADAQSGVALYRVYRDGRPIDTTTDTTCSDAGLLEDHTYNYQVSAVNGDGCESALSAATPATPAPSVQAARSLDGMHVTVTYGKPVERASAEFAGNYRLTYPVDQQIGVPRLTLQPDGRSVLLTLAAPLAEGVVYTVTVDLVEDLAGNAVAPGSQATFTYTAWGHQDIGAVAAAGDMGYDGGAFTIQASGADIWSDRDEFHYVYRNFHGSGEIVARVVGVTNTHSWAKAGVMIRESLSRYSTHAMTIVTPGNGIAFQRRRGTGGGSTHTGAAGSAPYWVKLVRIGDTFSGYRSADGTNWERVGTDSSITMGADAYVGLAVTAHNDGAVTTAVIDNVTVTLYDPPTLTLTEPAANVTVKHGQEVAITWSDGDGDDNAAIRLAYDPDDTATPWTDADHTWIARDLAEDPDGAGDSYVWNTAGAAVGTYTVWACIDDDTYDGVYHRAAGVVTIEPNALPVADAGDDQEVLDADGDWVETVALDASGSTDNEGPVSCVWAEYGTQIATGESPNVELAVGGHTIELTVTDTDGATDTDEVEVFVAPPLNGEPLVLISPFVNRDVSSGQTYSVRWFGGDAETSVRLWGLHLGGWQMLAEDLPGTDGGYNWDTNGRPPGWYSFTAEVHRNGDTTHSSSRAWVALHNGHGAGATGMGAPASPADQAGSSAPQAGDDRIETTPDTPVTSANLLANDVDPDGDPLEIVAFTQPSHGTVVYVGAGRFTYTPNPGFLGADAFTYEISDADVHRDGTDLAEVTVLVSA